MIFSVENPVSICAVNSGSVVFCGSVYAHDALNRLNGLRVVVYYLNDGCVYVCRLHGGFVCVAEEVGAAEYFCAPNESEWLMGRAAGWRAYVHH